MLVGVEMNFLASQLVTQVLPTSCYRILSGTCPLAHSSSPGSAEVTTFPHPYRNVTGPQKWRSKLVVLSVHLEQLRKTTLPNGL